MTTKPVLLCICDGFAQAEPGPGNAIAAARTPVLDALFEKYPHTLLAASGLAVGLPEGQMGNSEVGHTNIGAGRVVYQELTRITRDIEDGSFYENPVLVAAAKNAKAAGRALHVMGLLSDGGVHSHLEHLLALLRLAGRQGVERVYIHAFMDGRDVSPTSGAGFLRRLALEIKEENLPGQVATVSGRYFAMDRDNRWDRVEKAYRAIVMGEGEHPAARPAAWVEEMYAAGTTDEFLPPAVFQADARLQPDDSVVFFNFRPDRARELTRALVDDAFTGFARPRGRLPLQYVCFTQYDATMPGVEVAFAPQALTNTLGEVASRAGLRQLRIAETEKYAHVTFFFNGGAEVLYPGEDRILVKSPAVATYDLQPEMSAPEVTRRLVEQLDAGAYQLVVLNFANCDMVGHTGVFEAAVRAVETVDACLGQVVEAVGRAGGVALITADHGNADQMLADDGSPFTAHTTNPVPLLLVGAEKGYSLQSGGRLCDLAPTILELLGIPQPAEMTGHSLLQ